MGGSSVPELVSLSISAWSLKARFALKHHAIKYRTTPYMPLFGEVMLRLRLGEWRRKVTVPVMFTPADGVLLHSVDIAAWADSHGARPGAEQLFPAGREAEVRSWNEKSDVVLYYGRQALVESALEDPAVLRATVPPNLRWLGPLGRALVRSIISRLARKYQAEGSTTSLERALEVLREAQAVLRSGGEEHLVGGALTYADMAMAVATQVVKPLGPPFATTERSALKDFLPYQEEFADLLAWRDRTFNKHFPLDAERRKKNS